MMIINFLFYSLRMGTPLLFGTTGEILTEKSGSLNLGVEGMMAVGAIIGYVAACGTGSLLVGFLAAFLAAGVLGLLFAFLTVTMQANQNVTGLAITIFGVAVYKFIGRLLTTKETFPKFSDYPALQSAVADTGIPLLRDIPYVGRLLFSYNIFVYVAIAVAIICWVYIKKTRTGLRLLAVGENPGSADACGINVNLYKYLNITVGAGITGFGGLYLAMVTNGGAWNDNWINGMGWISVALVIFSNWSTVIAIFGAFFFGMFSALQSWNGNLASAFPRALGWVTSIPGEFYQMLTFAITALVLIISCLKKNKSSGEPSAIGLGYFREER